MTLLILWMSDCCLTLNEQYFSYIRKRTSYIRWYDDVRFVANKQIISVGSKRVLDHWNNSPRVYMSLHSDTLTWIRAKQSMLLLLKHVSLAENTKFVVFGLTRHRQAIAELLSVVLETSMLTITPPMRFPFYMSWCCPCFVFVLS